MSPIRASALGLIATLFFCTGCQILEPTFAFPGRLIRNISQNPGNSARKMQDDNSPDARREGINELVDRNFGQRPPYTTRYRQIAENDPDFTVRAIAIRALNRARDREATPTFIKALDDESELVRLEAAKALVNVPDANAIPALLKHAQPTFSTGRNDDRGRPIQREESKDVRIAVSDALKHYKTLDVARALVTNLDTREFGVAWQSRQSLINLTNKDFAFNQSTWLEYLTGPNKPLG